MSEAHLCPSNSNIDLGCLSSISHLDRTKVLWIFRHFHCCSYAKLFFHVYIISLYYNHQFLRAVFGYLIMGDQKWFPRQKLLVIRHTYLQFSQLKPAVLSNKGQRWLTSVPYWPQRSSDPCPSYYLHSGDISYPIISPLVFLPEGVTGCRLSSLSHL